MLLLDEPLGALDPLVRAELQDDLRGDLRARCGKTVVLVTHDLAEAAFFGRPDRAAARGPGRAARARSTIWSQRPADPFVTRFVQRPAAAPTREPAGGGA